MHRRFLLQRDAHKELLPPAESLLVGSLQTAHHPQLQDLQIKNVSLLAGVPVGAGELESQIEAKEKKYLGSLMHCTCWSIWKSSYKEYLAAFLTGIKFRALAIK